MWLESWIYIKMAKKELIILAKKAKRILEVDKNLRRKYFDKKPHIFTLTRTDLLTQIFAQLKIEETKVTPETKALIEGGVDKYIKTIRSVFINATPANFTYKVKNIPGEGFSVLVVSTDGSSVYNKIYQIRSRGDKPLKDLINTIRLAFEADEKTLSNISHLFDIGHEENYSIAEKTVEIALSRFGTKPPNNLSADEINELSSIYNIIASSNITSSTKGIGKTFTMRVGEEASRSNTLKGRTTESDFISDARKAVASFLENNIDWYNQGGSNTVPELIVLDLLSQARQISKKNKAIKKLKTNIRTKSQSNTPAEVIESITTKVSKPQVVKNTIEPIRQSRKVNKTAPVQQQNWLSLLPIINSKLTPRVIANMRFPSLVNRTGTFAQSAKVTNIENTREGFPSFVFDYARDPYDVFDRTKGRSPWNTPERDPRALVDKSVREVVREMAISRFYTRRA
jgi:hypothetical protein